MQATAQLFLLPLGLFSWGSILALFNYMNINGPSRSPSLLATLHKILGKEDLLFCEFYSLPCSVERAGYGGISQSRHFL